MHFINLSKPIFHFILRLTAFVVRSFARARRYIFIDDKEVEHSLEWFRTKQQANGCFPQYGTLFNKKTSGILVR